MAQRRTTQEQLDAARKSVEEKQERIKDLLKRQKKEERRERTHRLCERGGIVEKLIPNLIKLTSEQFETFVAETLLTGYAAKVLNRLLPPTEPQSETETAQDGGTAAEAGESSPKPDAVPKPENAALGAATGKAQNRANSASPGASPIH
jgi:hypothetical protein